MVLGAPVFADPDSGDFPIGVLHAEEGADLPSHLLRIGLYLVSERGRNPHAEQKSADSRGERPRLQTDHCPDQDILRAVRLGQQAEDGLPLFIQKTVSRNRHRLPLRKRKHAPEIGRFRSQPGEALLISDSPPEKLRGQQGPVPDEG